MSSRTPFLHLAEIPVKRTVDDFVKATSEFLDNLSYRHFFVLHFRIGIVGNGQQTLASGLDDVVGDESNRLFPEELTRKIS